MVSRRREDKLMAYYTHTDRGVPIWKPDRVTLKGKVLLDPKLSPMENLWKVIRIQASIWLCRYKVYSLDGPEEVDDLFYALMLRIFLDVRRKVWDGTWRRDLSVYLNVRSSAWAVTGNLLKRWRADQITRKETLNFDQLLLGNPDNSLKTLGDTVSYEAGRLSYVSDNESNNRRCAIYRARHRAKVQGTLVYKQKSEAMLKAMQKVRDAKEQQDEYDKYLSDCEFFGIEDRLDYASFIKQNYK